MMMVAVFSHSCHGPFDSRRSLRAGREDVVRSAGLALSLLYLVLIGWLFVRQPATVAEAAGGLSDTVGLYRIDEQAFADGVRYFSSDQFVEARAAFDRADPARRDATTQFYIAYSFYRQGWGRLYSDDALFKQGLEAVDRAIALAPGNRIAVEVPGPSERTGPTRITADELRAELEAGLRRDASDFNPLRVFKERR
jgi:hypothetical protein